MLLAHSGALSSIVEQLKMRVDVKETVNVMKFIRLQVFVQRAGKVSFQKHKSQHQGQQIIKLLTFINNYHSLPADIWWSFCGFCPFEVLLCLLVLEIFSLTTLGRFLPTFLS